MAEGTATSTTWLDQTQSPYTSTVSASGFQNGTVIYGSPSAATQTTTITRGGRAYTTTLVTGNQASAGTVQVSSHTGYKLMRPMLTHN